MLSFGWVDFLYRVVPLAVLLAIAIIALRAACSLIVRAIKDGRSG